MRKIVLIIAVILFAMAACAAAETSVVYSSKSGYISRSSPSSSFVSLNSDRGNMMYYTLSGTASTTGSVHYEWFNLSSMPSNAVITSATLQLFHDRSRLGTDRNNLMSPATLSSSQRVTLGKLLEPFSTADSYTKNGARYKNQAILSKVDRVSTSPADYILQYNVTDVVTGWQKGETNYGFSFLGNYNSLGLTSTRYYFGNSQTYKPKLIINYTIPVVPVCGNSVKEGLEQCDNGSANGIACTAAYGGKCVYCSAACTNVAVVGAYCGDALVNGPEQCDKGAANTNSSCAAQYGGSCSYCDTSCITHNVSGGYCGNGIKEASEECDDGNTAGGDGCSALCALESVPVCGNGVVEAPEQCDDGNSLNTDACLNNCTNAYCGDGYIRAGIEECDDGNTVNGDGCSSCAVEQTGGFFCQYAASASADNENPLGSLAAYAIGAPDAPVAGCGIGQWSGYGYSWSPSNWNVKATLTLKYDTPVMVSNFTIFGDYDICWNRIWLRNSNTGAELQVFNGYDSSCMLTMQSAAGFLADSLAMETCGWAWTSTDAAQLCGYGKMPEPPVQAPVSICTWKGCKKGAVSVSVDDYYTSCIEELDNAGLKGTYFLTDTGSYSSSLWSQFNSAFNKGHELGTHTVAHFCSAVSQSEFIADMNQNIADITSNTGATAADLVSHAYSCGYADNTMKNALKNNWNFLSSRGYYFNQLESSTPSDYFDLKSFNSIDYPGGNWDPPSYYALADQAEQQGKWLIMTFHVDCDDGGVISTLPSRNLWTDTIGNVVRYIKLRDNAQITNYQESAGQVSFDVSSSLTASVYRQNLTLQLGTAAKPASVNVNSQPVAYSWNNGLLMFDLPFPAQANVIILLQ